METYGNPNLLHAGPCQYVDYDTADTSAGLSSRTIAVDLYATTDCWVRLVDQGGSQVAALPSAEKEVVGGFFLRAEVEKSIPVPLGTAALPVKVSVVKVTTAGRLYITERRP